MKKRLGILIYSLGGGGAERVLLTLLPHLKAAFDVFLFVLEDKNSYGVDVKYEVIGNSKSTDSALMKLLRLPFLARLLAAKLKEHNITHCFSLLNRPNYINIMALPFASHTALISEHATPSLQYQKGIGGKINKFLIRYLYPRAAHIVTVSHGVCQDLIHNFNIPQTHITTIYNPFDMDAIYQQSLEESPRIAFLKQEKDKGRMVFVSIGRLDSGKNHHIILEAMQALCLAMQKPPLLFILGQGELHTQLQEYITNNKLEDCIYLEGFVANPYPYIKHAQATVCASLHEGFLNVLVESLALGVMPISSDCPNGPREILQSQMPAYNHENEITPYGILFPSHFANISKAHSLSCLIKILQDVCSKSISFDADVLKSRAMDFEQHKIAAQYITLFISKM